MNNRKTNINQVARALFMKDLEEILWKDEVLESELTNYTFGVRDGEQCIFLEY